MNIQKFLLVQKALKFLETFYPTKNANSKITKSKISLPNHIDYPLYDYVFDSLMIPIETSHPYFSFLWSDSL